MIAMEDMEPGEACMVLKCITQADAWGRGKFEIASAMLRKVQGRDGGVDGVTAVGALVALASSGLSKLGPA